jgi:hypothetical protein
MKLPPKSHPLQRRSFERLAGEQPEAGIQPAQVAVQHPWVFHNPAPGNCTCALNNRLNYYVPNQNGCKQGYAPQCNSQGGCSCVPAAQQRLLNRIPGAVVNMAPVNQFIQDLGF